MKKLKLKLLELASSEILTADQLKFNLRSVMGGYQMTCSCGDGRGSIIACSSLQECIEVCQDVCA